MSISCASSDYSNYLYALLEAEARLALNALGLDPGIGVLHFDARTRDSLACDLMEPVRPQVDLFLFGWLRQTPLRRNWFLEERNGNCRLASSLAAKLSETCLTWRRAVAPFAEGIARALWSKHAEGHIRPPATRLTQNHRRVAKDIFPELSVTKPLRPESSCRFCGTAIKFAQKYCRNCLPTVWRENVLKAGKLGRLNTHKPEAQARRSETQKRQNAALKAWKPATLPGWLNETAYREKIQPCLPHVIVSEIMSVLAVSEPYALRIRSGKCVPHPRHWASLAKLASYQG